MFSNKLLSSQKKVVILAKSVCVEESLKCLEKPGRQHNGGEMTFKNDRPHA